jgi:hypothetical protein
MTIPTHIKRQFAERGWVFDDVLRQWHHPEGVAVFMGVTGRWHAFPPCGGFSVFDTWAALITHLRSLGIWPERRGRPRKPTPCPLP